MLGGLLSMIHFFAFAPSTQVAVVSIHSMHRVVLIAVQVFTLHSCFESFAEVTSPPNHRAALNRLPPFQFRARPAVRVCFWHRVFRVCGQPVSELDR